LDKKEYAQVISYEVSMGLFLMPVVFLAQSINLTEIVLCQQDLFYCVALVPSAVLFSICMLAETK